MSQIGEATTPDLLETADNSDSSTSMNGAHHLVKAASSSNSDPVAETNANANLEADSETNAEIDDSVVNSDIHIIDNSLPKEEEPNIKETTSTNTELKATLESSSARQPETSTGNFDDQLEAYSRTEDHDVPLKVDDSDTLSNTDANVVPATPQTSESLPNDGRDEMVSTPQTPTSNGFKNDNHAVPDTSINSLPHVSQQASPPQSNRTPTRLRQSHVSMEANALFDLLLQLKEVKKNETWKSSIQQAIDNPSDIEATFIALKKTCELTSLATMKSKAIDGFVKIFELQDLSDTAKTLLSERAVDVISACFEGEATDSKVELQVIRALMNCILGTPCHGATLLKAVRQIYNVFVFSLSPANQAVAQGLLTQVINAIYQRIDLAALDSLELGSRLDLEFTSNGQVTLEKMEQLNLLREDDDVDGTGDVAIKDAYLIFRAMCKISVKLIEGDSIDMRLHSVRSKLLLLHIIHTILKEHIDVFLSPKVVINETLTRLTTLVKPYICLLLSKNAGLPLAPVYELSLEIFWLIMSNMRSYFKQEIPVFWEEIYFPVAEMKTSTPHQKQYLLLVIERICNDLRCIIEFYLNYDCEKGMPNICEKIVAYLSKLANTIVDVTPLQRQAFSESKRNGISGYDMSRNLTLSAMLSKPPQREAYDLFPLEYALKMNGIACVVGFLRSIHTWAHKGMNKVSVRRDRLATIDLSALSLGTTRNNSVMALADPDDPSHFELLKQHKKLFNEGVRQFNAKGKKGIKFFLQHGFLEDSQPKTIAKFLLTTEELDKAEIGEYLGEGDDEHIAIMHAFVDEMDFTNMGFVDALRQYLQLFRLPGEAQKIDRYMLKFAERYVVGNPGIFANADTAYVLAYSVIMLNTDQHSPQIKLRMTVELFIANNTGIDDGQNLDPEFLSDIYEIIRTDEIKLQLEQHAALLAGELKLPQALSLGLFFGSRDVNKEAYFHAYREMANKTEQMFKNIKSEGEFHAATHVYHVKLIFDTVWMIILPVLTLPLNTYDDYDICRTCLEGIKLSIKIACMFDIDTARDAFLNALIAVQKLYNYDEMKSKSVEAILIMLEVAGSDGSGFHSLWKTVLTAISQIERLQLIAQGVDQQLIPDVLALRISRSLMDSVASLGFFSSYTPSQQAANKFHNQQLRPDVAALLSKTTILTAIDRVFTNSSELSGEGIVEFVKALSEVSAEEIELSGQLNNPRTFSLQKIVDVCYYNMLRIRLEWSQLWLVMGEIFNTCGCHSNPAISFFALDSLRQLSVRFFDIEELANFKFQREFLKPFEYVISHNRSVDVKDMVLECINVMVLAKASHIKSGWKTIFGVLTAAAKEKHEQIVMRAYKMASAINQDFAEEVQRDSFVDLVGCFTELARNERFQRISLLALDVLIKLIQDLSLGFEKHEPSARKEILNRLWLPVFSGLHSIIMGGDELEVRLRALANLFDTLKEYGTNFDREFWDQIMEKVLLPIFSIVNGRLWSLGIDDDSTDDKLSVWLLTTFIQALNLLVALVTLYFDAMRPHLKAVLQLLVLCVCQENDTIAKIGRECFYLLLVNNAHEFNEFEWEEVMVVTQQLFEYTTATELFTLDPLKRVPSNDANDGFTAQAEHPLKSVAPKEKLLIVVKSVLQLYMLQSLSELFENDAFYEAIPYTFLINLANLLKKLYEFAHMFNDDYDLRVRLWNGGVIERLPNLLKQELSSLAVFINIMFRMYCDDEKCLLEQKEEILKDLIPLCEAITLRFVEYDTNSHQRYISIWQPVIVEIYQGYIELDDDDFLKHAPVMFKKTLELFNRSIDAELLQAVKQFLSRVGNEFISGL